ncbi:MAG TPA: hypothetical protein VNQ79_20595 [Blastocatellia bacterium]|nr:hypothetical protein [Blastocatellia bacterium]
MTFAQPVTDEHAEMLLRALNQTEKPLSAIKPLSEAGLRKGIPRAACPPKPRFKQLLDELTAQRLVRSAREKSSVVYWSESRDQQLCAALSRALAERPLSEKDLAKAAGCSAALLKAVLKRLTQEGRVQQWPPLKGKTPLYSLQAPDPLFYLKTSCAAPLKKLKDTVTKTGKQLASAGVSEPQIARALDALLRQALSLQERAVIPEPDRSVSDDDFSRLILARMVELDPSAANGALVSVRQLHRSLKAEAADAEQFNRVVLRLYAQGAVDLTRHHHPASLPEDERREMVIDARGNHYNGIVLRA